jgi:hypothetical protein
MTPLAAVIADLLAGAAGTECLDRARLLARGLERPLRSIGRAPAPQQAKHRLVRLIAGNPVTMGEMTRHVADAGSYAPVTILIQELPDGRNRIAYDSVASAIAPYHDAAASEVARRLDAEVLTLLREVTGAPASSPT